MGQHPETATLDGDDARALAPAVWRCYDKVFGDFEEYETWRADLYERHIAREGFRLAVSRDGASVAGFAWGYVGRPGQYWTDLAAAALPSDVAARWVGGHFEVVELAVLPTARNHGLGQALHDELLSGIRQQALLSTADDPADPAVRLYLRNCWAKLGNLTPGVQIMGRPAPTNQ